MPPRLLHLRGYPECTGALSNTFTVPSGLHQCHSNQRGTGRSGDGEWASWLPPQQLNVSISAGEGSAHREQCRDTRPDGSFSTILTIPGNAGAGTYTVRVYATNETSMPQRKITF